MRILSDRQRGAGKLDAAELGEAAYTLDVPAPAVGPSAATVGG